MASIVDYCYKHPHEGGMIFVECPGYRNYLVYFTSNGTTVCVQVANGGRNCYQLEVCEKKFESIRASSPQLPETVPLLKAVVQTALDWYRAIVK